MKMCERLQELLKCDTETQSEQMLWKNGADGLPPCRVATNVQLVTRERKKKKKSTICEVQ